MSTSGNHGTDPNFFLHFFFIVIFSILFSSFSLSSSSLDFWKITSKKKKKRNKPDKHHLSRPISLNFFPVFLPRLLLHLHPPGLSLTQHLAQTQPVAEENQDQNDQERKIKKEKGTDCADLCPSFPSPTSPFSSTSIPPLDSIFSIPLLFVPINLLGRFVNITS